MAKTRGAINQAPLNRYAIRRLIEAAEMLFGEGLLDDAQMRTVLASIENRRQPGAGTGSDELENAKANLDVASNPA